MNKRLARLAKGSRQEAETLYKKLQAEEVAPFRRLSREGAIEDFNALTRVRNVVVAGPTITTLGLDDE